MNELIFEWYENKDLINQHKHQGISFEKAKTVFADELGLLISDPEQPYGKERFILLGRSAYPLLLLVCHCEIDGGTIRILSVRGADERERKQYEQGERYA